MCKKFADEFRTECRRFNREYVPRLRGNLDAKCRRECFRMTREGSISLVKYAGGKERA